jgi:hypothetical protein
LLVELKLLDEPEDGSGSGGPPVRGRMGEISESVETDKDDEFLRSFGISISISEGKANTNCLVESTVDSLSINPLINIKTPF